MLLFLVVLGIHKSMCHSLLVRSLGIPFVIAIYSSCCHSWFTTAVSQCTIQSSDFPLPASCPAVAKIGILMEVYVMHRSNGQYQGYFHSLLPTSQEGRQLCSPVLWTFSVLAIVVLYKQAWNTFKGWDIYMK